MPNQAEVILNLWFVQDHEGIVYSLRARAYVGSGADDKDLAFLRRQAEIDYRIASVFPIPKQYHASVDDQIMPVSSRFAIDATGEPLAIFEDAIRALGEEFPLGSDALISSTPLVCITTLVGTDESNLRVVISSTREFS